jgi:hypothetical protein
MRKITVIILVIGIIWACKKQNTDPMINPEIAKIRDFEIELPYGNELFADGISRATFVPYFYDINGEVLDIEPDQMGNLVKLKIDGLSENFKLNEDKFAFKTNTIGNHKLSYEINSISKEVNLVAKANNGLASKTSEFQLLFRVINDDFPQAYFENTINYLNDIYAVQNKMNVKFKLAEFDEIGNKLKRKGVQIFKDETFKADDSPKLGIIKYGADKKNALNIYVLEKDASTNWSGLWNGENFQLNTLIFSNKRLGDGRSNPAFTVMAHEVGHYFGLAHIYRNDNNCLVQAGVNDIEAYNNANGSQTTTLQKQGKYMSNCGKIWKRENLMDGGEEKITKDQKNVIYLSPNFK